MIKNLLYSVFLHLLIITVIFISFTDNKIKENVIEISVTLMNNEPQKTLPPQEKTEIPLVKKAEEKPKEPEVKEEKKPEPKKEEPKKEEKKPEPEPKKEEKKPEPKPKKEEKGKPELKKPEEEPKKEEKKPEPKKEEKKLEEKKPEPEKEMIKQITQEMPVTTEDSKEIRLNVTDVDLTKTLEKANLLTREKLNIQYQLMVCYKRAVDESKKESKTSVIIKVFIDKQGIIHHNLNDIIDVSKYNEKNSDYKIAIDNVRRAFVLCNPLRNLPLDKYDVWKELVLEFKNLEN